MENWKLVPVRNPVARKRWPLAFVLGQAAGNEALEAVVKERSAEHRQRDAEAYEDAQC